MGLMPRRWQESLSKSVPHANRALPSSEPQTRTPAGAEASCAQWLNVRSSGTQNCMVSGPGARQNPATGLPRVGGRLSI